MRRVAVIALIALAGCGDGEVPGVTAIGCDADAPASRTISCVSSVTFGPHAGRGQGGFPEIVYGPPHGAGTTGGNTDSVLSLGARGEIVVGFGGARIVDGDGPDFLVFENPFWIAGHEEVPFDELAEIAVSDDGASWTTFPCHADAYPYDGCAGWHVVLATPASGEAIFDPAAAGGDPFDLADVGVASARFVRIRDLGTRAPDADDAGFDLDAAAIVHGE